MATLFNFECLREARLAGPAGERLNAHLENWTLPMPQANPALFQRLWNRDMHGLAEHGGGQLEYLGKYLTGAAYHYALCRDERLAVVLRDTADRIRAAQDESGYLGTESPANHFIRQDAKEMEKKYTWDLWCHYHGILGLLACYRALGYAPALETAVRAMDCIVTFFAERSLWEVRCGFTNLAIGHAAALLYRQTGREAYLSLARRAVDAMADPRSESGNYLEGTLAGLAFYQLSNARWEGLHAVEAFAELYRITGEARYRDALEHIWRGILQTDRHNTGGFTSDEKAVGNPYDLRGIETCCTVAWTVLSAQLLRIQPDSRVADELELSLFNGLLAAQHPSGRHSTYNTPMIGDKKASMHEIVFQSTAGAPEINCCSVNIGRGLAGMAEWGFLPTAEGLYIHYYGESRVCLTLPDGNEVWVTQHTDYPRDGRIELSVTPRDSARLTVFLRIPAWSARTSVLLNGEPVQGAAAGQYLALDRVWIPDDRVTLFLDMTPHIWAGDGALRGKCAVYHGPLLLAYDYRFNGLTERPFRPIDVSGTPVPTFSKPIAYDFSDAPILAGTPADWSRLPCDGLETPRPWVMFQAVDAEGKPVYLCDFVSAGQTGNPYTTWLPMENAPAPVPLESCWGTPIWCGRMGG